MIRHDCSIFIIITDGDGRASCGPRRHHSTDLLIRFLAGCRKRRLNQTRSVRSVSLIFSFECVSYFSRYSTEIIFGYLFRFFRVLFLGRSGLFDRISASD